MVTRTDYTPFSSAASGLSVTSGSYTFPNNSFVVVDGIFINDGGGTDAPIANITLTNSGSDLGWTKRTSADNGNTDFSCGVAQWTTTGTGVACTLTATKVGNNVGSWFLFPTSYTGHDTGSPVGGKIAAQLLSTSGAGSVDLDATPASTSEIHAALGAVLNSGDVNATPGTGYGEVYDTAHTDWALRQIQTRTGTTSPTVSWADVGSGGGGNYHLPIAAALEIKSAAGGSDTPLAVDVGEVAFAGQTIGLHISMPVTSADIVAEGQNITLISESSIVFPVTAGEIVAEGQQVPFILTNPGDAAQIVAEGQSIALRLSEGITAGEIVAEGQTVGLLTGGNTSISVEAGSIVITGSTIGLTATGQVVTAENMAKAMARPFTKKMVFSPTDIGRRL